MARIPLPPAPPRHDERNQNEARRAIATMIREVETRLAKIEADLDG